MFFVRGFPFLINLVKSLLPNEQIKKCHLFKHHTNVHVARSLYDDDMTSLLFLFLPPSCSKYGIIYSPFLVGQLALKKSQFYIKSPLACNSTRHLVSVLQSFHTNNLVSVKIKNKIKWITPIS
jgi:hypothetical protein